MAYTFEYPPSFASHCPLDIERSGVLPATYQLRHHFFLTRLKLVVKEVFTRPRAQYLLDGMQQELVQYTLTFHFALISLTWQNNVLISHGICSVMGLDVPSPYFLQELVIAPIIDPDDKDFPAALARIFISLEVSERDAAFVQKICGQKFDWWNIKNGHYPCYQDLVAVIDNKVYEVRASFRSFEGSPP